MVGATTPPRTASATRMSSTVSIVLTLAACSLAAGCRAKSPRDPSSDVIADSVSGFSGEQGANGWSYGYWDRSADADGIYDPITDFQLLVRFGGDNELSSRDEFTTGDLWNIENGLYYTSLWAEGGHPHAVMDLGDYAQAEHWPVRRWVSTVDGPVTLSGRLGKVMPWGENWQGACRARIVVDGTTVFDAPMDNDGRDYAIDAAVRIGSRVDWMIGPDPSIGVTQFTATIRKGGDR